ncbi:MAG: hypothetical protein FRX49_12146 [Trebouxia sp. A1-2]|nr:MAG: hypothetical protein FRX49_12146 [Trebouxia sp. A1-2]
MPIKVSHPDEAFSTKHKFSVASGHTSDDQLQQSGIWLGVLQSFSLQESLHCHWQPGRGARALRMMAGAHKDVDSDGRPALTLCHFLKLPNLTTKDLESLIHMQPMQGASCKCGLEGVGVRDAIVVVSSVLIDVRGGGCDTIIIGLGVSGGGGERLGLPAGGVLGDASASIV